MVLYDKKTTIVLFVISKSAREPVIASTLFWVKAAPVVTNTQHNFP